MNVRRYCLIVLLAWAVVDVLYHRNAFGASRETAGERACESGETWRYSQAIPGESSKQFSDLLAGKTPGMRSFSQALAARRRARTLEARRFAEYWVARSLVQLGAEGSAAAGYSYIAAEVPEPETVGIQVSAIACLNVLREKNAVSASLDPLVPRIRKLLSMTDDPRHLQTLWRTAGALIREQLSAGASSAEVDATLSLLDGAGIHEHLARGLVAAARNDHDSTIESLRKTQNRVYQGTSEWNRFGDRVHLLLGRAYYAKKRFPEAMNELKKIQKSSNELVEGLSELAWSALLAGRYSEAIGAALSLQTGGLRRTFAPEAPMVMAMALNEICQYPESLRATDSFRKVYEGSYHWLSRWKEPSTARTQGDFELYRAAVEYLKRKKTTVPERLASEWVRSPIFIASQEQLNRLSREGGVVKNESRAAAAEQKRDGKAITASSQVLLAKLTRFKLEKKPKALLAGELADFRRKVADYQDFRRAAADWRGIVERFETQAPALKQALEVRIEKDLARRNTRMFRMLEEVAENNQLIEAEIYGGASKDIIWLNAHPDYKEVLAGAKNEPGPSRSVWEWGRASPLAEEWSEIWEDELGALEANLFDNCSNKTKYLAIKRLKAGFQRVASQDKAVEKKTRTTQ